MGAFLNSNFGIWLLTTVVVGLFSFTYTSYNECSKENESTYAKINAIVVDLAVRHRTAQSLVLISDRARQKDKKPILERAALVLYYGTDVKEERKDKKTHVELITEFVFQVRNIAGERGLLVMPMDFLEPLSVTMNAAFAADRKDTRMDAKDYKDVVDNNKTFPAIFKLIDGKRLSCLMGTVTTHSLTPWS